MVTPTTAPARRPGGRQGPRRARPWMPWRVAVAALLALAGCRQAEHADPVAVVASLNGRFLSGRPVLMVPDDDWGYRGFQRAWHLRGPASLLCHVREDAAGPLLVRLELMGSGSISATFGGRAVARSTFSGLETLAFAIPGELAIPGAHRLHVAMDDPAACISRVTMASRAGTEELRGEDLARARALAPFLAHGLFATAGPEWRSGVLVEGPRQLDVPVHLDAPATFTVEGVNRTGGRANVLVRAGAEEVRRGLRPGEASPIELPIPRGATTIHLSVDGPENGLFLWAGPHLSRETPRPRPSLILVTLDTTRRDAVAPYRGAARVTPVLEDLAASATLFERAHATAPWTLPSHASMFTGRYPSGHGAGTSSMSLGDSSRTLAEILRDHGYVTGGVSAGPLTSFRRGLGQGFSRYYEDPESEMNAERVTAISKRFVAAHRGQPFLLFVNYFDPHMPYAPPEASLAPVARAAPGADDTRRRYLGEVSFVDAAMGDLLRALRDFGLYDGCLLAVVADHGELLGERGLTGHSFRLDPELVDIPLLLKWPLQRAGRRDASVVSLVDVFPTFLQAASITPPAQDGLPLGDAARLAARRRVLMEEHAREGIHDLAPGPMKIADHVYGIVEPSSRAVVWDGGSDCARMEAGAWQPAPCPESWDVMLAGARRDLPAMEPGSTADMGQDEADALRALGYLQ